jgi:hypothetical protein
MISDTLGSTIELHILCALLVCYKAFYFALYRVTNLYYSCVEVVMKCVEHEPTLAMIDEE